MGYRRAREEDGLLLGTSLPATVNQTLTQTKWRWKANGGEPTLCAADADHHGGFKEACYPLADAWPGAEKYVILLLRTPEHHPRFAYTPKKKLASDAMRAQYTRAVAKEALQAEMYRALGLKLPTLVRTGRLDAKYWPNLGDRVRECGTSVSTIYGPSVRDLAHSLGGTLMHTRLFPGAAGQPRTGPTGYIHGSTFAFVDPLDAEKPLPAYHLRLLIDGEERFAMLQQRLEPAADFHADRLGHNRGVTKSLAASIDNLLRTARGADFLRALWRDLHRLLALLTTLNMRNNDLQFIITRGGEVYLIDPGPATFRRHQCSSEVVVGKPLAWRHHAACCANTPPLTTAEGKHDHVSHACSAIRSVENAAGAQGRRWSITLANATS